MMLRQRRRAEHHVALLQLLLANLDGRGDHRRRVLGFGTGVRNVGEGAFEQALDVVVLEVADRHHHEVPGDVGVLEVLRERLASERVHAVGRAENGAAERMAAPEAFRENLVDQIVGGVLDHLDLFEDDLLLFLDVVLGHQRVADQVGENFDRERQVLIEHLEVIAGVFLGGKGIDLPADRIHLLRDFFRRPGGRALEEHVLDKVRDAHAFRRFVPRAAREPDADGD